VAVAAGCMFAEPVPVRRPGVCLMGVDERDDTGTVSGIGKTKIGLNLRKYNFQLSVEMRKIETNLMASQTTSIHEAQFETIISPARGFHVSFVPSPFLLYKNSQTQPPSTEHPRYHVLTLSFWSPVRLKSKKDRE